MSEKIKIAVVGYGNVGRGVEQAITQNPDTELAGIYSRREPATVKPVIAGSKVFHVDDLAGNAASIDVAILCGGSATDLPVQGPQYAALCNIVDSFDTHAKIPEYYDEVDAAARAAGKIAVISTGWDPGLFSLLRVMGESILPSGAGYTFWGKGVSQGHSDALRRIDGVKDAIQYTIPIQAAVDRVRSGENPEMSTREKHLRECFVVAEEGADRDRIEKEIKEMV